jgi:hypothetical protein
MLPRLERRRSAPAAGAPRPGVRPRRAADADGSVYDLGGWRATTLGRVTVERTERVGPRTRRPTVLSSTKHFGLVPSDEYFRNRVVYSDDLALYKRVDRHWFAYATNHLAEGSIGLQQDFDDACVSPIYTVFSVLPDAYPRYLHRLLGSSRLIDRYRVAEQASVDRRGAVRYRDFATIRIMLPPLDEQRRIVVLLDAVDEAIRSAERSVEKAEQARRGLFADLMAVGLDGSGRRRDPAADRAAAAAAAADADADARAFVETAWGRFPCDWAVASLGHALLGIEAGSSPDLPDEPAGPGEWGVLKVSAVRPAGLREDENKAVRDRSLIDPAGEVADGDVLMSRANTAALVGLACFVRNPRRGLMLSDKTLRLRPDRRRIVPEFLSQLLSTPAARRQLETSGTGSSGSMKNISQADIRNLVLPFPDLAEQQRILDVTAASREALLTSARGLAKLRELRKGLTDDLLTGRVRMAETTVEVDLGHAP